MNTEIFNQVVSEAKAKTTDAAWLRSLDKAAKMLASGELCVTLFSDNTALVTSPNASYRVNGTCPCASRQAHCYHRCAKRIWTLYEAAILAAFAADVAESPRQHLIIEIENLWNRVEPTVHLADALVARFGKNRLDMLPTETLRDIRLALAA